MKLPIFSGDPSIRTSSSLRTRGGALGMLLAFLLNSTTFAQPEVNPDNVEAFFDAAFAVQKQDHYIAGAVVSVVKDGEVLFQSGYGYADIEARVPADANTSLFRIASISKTFVWTAIMQLHEQGRLNIDDNVNDYLTSFKIPDTFEEPVRIRHLLTHSPGFEDQAVGMNAPSLEKLISVEEYLATRPVKRVRPPGELVAYSNWGTTLAGYIVEQVTGQKWDDYVDAHILSPLQMNSTNTHTPLPEGLAANHAKSYVYGNGRFSAKPYEALNDAPAGVMSTTADDMTRFMIAHLGDGSFKEGRILSPETTALMQQPLHVVHSDMPAMLYGFYESNRNGIRILGHGGDTNQFHSRMALLPDQGIGVFIAFNSDPGAAARDSLFPAFMDHFFPTDHLRVAPEPIQLDLVEYEGEYIPLRVSATKFEKVSILVTGVSINASDNNLVINGNSRWVAIAKDEFTGLFRDRLMIFHRDEGDNISHVTIGAPLATLKKVSGLDAPSNQRLIMGLMLLIAAIAVLGYGYRLVVPASHANAVLPTVSIAAAWLHSLLLMILYTIMAVTLAGDVEEFVLGVPIHFHYMLYTMVANSILGVLIIYWAVRNWQQTLGMLGMRIRFSLVALMAIMNLWIAWYFNFLSYPWSGIPVIS